MPVDSSKLVHSPLLIERAFPSLVMALADLYENKERYGNYVITISEFTKNRFVQWAPKGPFSSVTQKSTNCGNTLYNDLYKPPSN